MLIKVQQLKEAEAFMLLELDTLMLMETMEDTDFTWDHAQELSQPQNYQ